MYKYKYKYKYNNSYLNKLYPINLNKLYLYIYIYKMVFKQLFVSIPPIHILKQIVNSFGLKSLCDTTEFSYLDMNKYNTLDVFRNLETELRKYYLPCKQKIYFNNINNLTNKEAITILRQLLQIHDYDLNSREKFIKGIKYSVYKLITKQEKIFNIHKKKNKEIIIVFD